MSDSRAFEAIFHAHSRAVYRYALRRVGSQSAQDAVSETFMVAWRRQHELDGDPLPWLLGIARRVCANQLRSRSRSAALCYRLASEPRPEEEEPSGADHHLRRALATLSEPDRELLALVAWDGLTNEQAAQVLDCAKATVAVRLHRARRRLRKALGPDTGEKPADASAKAVANEIS